MTDAEVIDSMLDRLSGKRAAPTVRDALRELLEAIDTLEGVTFSRDLEPYKAEAVWDDAVRRAQDALAAAEKDESELVAALRMAVQVAGEARLVWDAAPAGMRAGKILIALSGGCPGYRADTDEIHRILAKHAKE